MKKLVDSNRCLVIRFKEIFLKYIELCFIVFFLFQSCKKKSDNPPPIVIPASNRVFISCEGDFGNGNTEISFYDENKKSVINNFFNAVNGFKPGDVIQSMTELNGYIYIVVNNSSKIIVANSADFKFINEITIPHSSPRYLIYAGHNKAYVSDLYSNKIAVLDLSTNTVLKYISINGWTEQMIKVNNNIYISNEKSEYVLIVNSDSDKVIDSIHVTYGSNSFTLDDDYNLWVGCGGDSLQNKTGGIFKIETSTNKILYKYLYTKSSETVFHICYYNGNIYYINKNIYQLDSKTPIGFGKTVISGNRKNFYSLAVNKNNGNIYVADVKDFISGGKIYRFDSSVSLIDEFSVSIGPGNFLFN